MTASMAEPPPARNSTPNAPPAACGRVGGWAGRERGRGGCWLAARRVAGSWRRGERRAGGGSWKGSSGGNGADEGVGGRAAAPGRDARRERGPAHGPHCGRACRCRRARTTAHSMWVCTPIGRRAAQHGGTAWRHRMEAQHGACLAHGRVAVAERPLHRRQDRAQVLRQLGARGVLYHLAQPRAHALRSPGGEERQGSRGWRAPLLARLEAEGAGGATPKP